VSLAVDLRYLRRSMVRSPGPAVAVWACTAIWMAVAPALLSLLGALEWKSLPFPDSGRIVHVQAGIDLVPTLAASGRFRAVSSYDSGRVVAEGPRGEVTAGAAAVDDSFFRVFGTRAVAGRLFSGPSDAGGAVLSERLSRRLFGGVPPPGASLRAAGRPLTVLGVVPDQPAFPSGVELWFLYSSGILPDRTFFPASLGIAGRLADGVGVQAADAAVRLAAREWEAKTEVMLGEVEVVTMDRLLRRRSSGERGILGVALTGLLGFVLLAQTSALAGFLAERQAELALRISLGAGRLDLVRLLLLEILLLAVPGFLVGLPLAALVLGRLSGLVPAGLAELIPPRLDTASLGVAAAGWTIVSLLAAAGVWLATPEAGSGSILVHERFEVRRTRPRARVRLALVCAALGLAVALGASTAVLRRSLANLERTPLGFEPRNRITAVLRFAEPPEPDRLPALLSRIADRLANVPGVETVAFSDALPIAAPAGYLEISAEGQPELWLTRIQGIQGEYLDGAGLRLLAGRAPTPQEEAAGAPVALLDQDGAREIFAGRSPLGRTVLLGERSVEIIGIVPSTVGTSLEEARRPQLYLPLRFRSASHGPAAVAILARVSKPVGEAGLAAAVGRTGVTVSQVRPLPEILETSLAPRRLARDMAGLQWLAALALAALATFGTFSWLLEVRAHELAVRLALGDTRKGITLRVLRGALGLVAASALLGAAVYLPAAQALRALLFGVEALSPAALLEAMVAVGGVALAAVALAVGLTLRRLSLDPLRNPASSLQ
jgi:putative ABC transport system permease protein